MDSPLNDTSRTLSDSDIDALVTAFHTQGHLNCRFHNIQTEEMREAILFVKNFNAAMAESKGVVRRTVLTLLVGGLVALIMLGTGVKLKEFIGQ